MNKLINTKNIAIGNIIKRVKPFITRRSQQLISIFLILVILGVNNAMAAPIVIGTAKELKVSATFWFLSNDWINSLFFSKVSPPAPQNQEASIRRIQIYPGSITVRRDQQVVFNAIAFDENDEPINGVKFNWTKRNAGRNAQPFQMADTKFIATAPGTFEIAAEFQGQRASVTVTVRKDEPSARRASSNIREPIRVSSRDAAPENKTNKSKTSQKDANNSSSTPELNMNDDESGWNDSNYWSADEPYNSVGDPLGQPEDGGAGSNNFQFSAPVLSLPGRGIDLNLALSYNSRLWNKANNELTYDIDGGWPAPGWSLGFGKIVNMGPYGGNMLIDADGTRHPYNGVIDSNGTRFRGYTTDGTFIDYECTLDNVGVPFKCDAKFPNGTQIHYFTSRDNNNVVHPVSIADAQGNEITITYRYGYYGWGPDIETIVDTLGRAITFHYDYLGRLIKINAPKLGGGTRTAVQLYYRQHWVNPVFAPGITPIVRNHLPWGIDAIYYPATNTGYWFDDSSYSTYGMITKVTEQRGMSWNYTHEEQGIVIPGQTTKQAVYNYPPGPIGGLTDAPTYTTLTETWEGMDDEPAVTTYNVQKESGATTTTITHPNGTKNKQVSFNSPGAWLDGLVQWDQTLDSNGNQISHSYVSWNPGAYDSPRPIRTEVTDERGQMKATEFSYGPYFNQVTSARDYNYDGTLLRETRTEYENSSNYIGTLSSQGISQSGQHILNLVKNTEVFAPSGTRISRTDYEYDEHPLANAPNVGQHQGSHNPYKLPYEDCYFEEDPHDPDCFDWNPCLESERPPTCNDICELIERCQTITIYDPATAYRGNVTRVRTYTDAANLTGAIEETYRYDITGNLISSSNSCCEQTSDTYTLDTQYAYPTSETRGSSDPNSPARVTTSTLYDYNTGLELQESDENDRVSTNEYDPLTLRLIKVVSSTGAYTAYTYDDTAMTITETVFAVDNAITSKNVKRLNGLALVKREEALAPNNAWDAVEMKYDKLGRLWKQSRPYRAGTEQPVWSENFYDAVGRVIKAVDPDGSESKVFYNEPTRPDSASNLPGQTVRSVNAWGRERWIRHDAKDRVVEVVEPNPNSNGSVLASGSLVTKYYYNTLGNLIETEQGAQRRYFAYDSLGRLIKQKLAEQTATLNDAGVYVGPGGAGARWSEAFVYDNRSNLRWRTDARGVITYFEYQVGGADDPLNRLQSVSYDLSHPHDSSRIIPVAGMVSYEYMPTGDVTRLKKVTAAGASTEEYAYDGESRVKDYTLMLASRPSNPFVTSYLYDSLDQVTDVRYPAQYGQLNNPQKVVHHNYDIASRLSSLTYDGNMQASDIIYNASSQATQLKIGATGANQVTETYSYDNQTGLLANQKVLRGSNSLMDLSYDYLRNGTSSGRTGHLTKLINNLDHNKDRAYEYDTLGRLTKATGGINATWSQNYAYDRYGNRTGVSITGVEANRVSLESAKEGQTGGDKTGVVPLPESPVSKLNRVMAHGVDNKAPTEPQNKETLLKTNSSVEQTNSTSSTHTPFDFDGDGKADVSVWGKGNGNWIINKSSGGTDNFQLGGSGTKAVPADYDGDGKTDKAVWVSSTGIWKIKQSSNGILREQQWGISTDVLVPADYDGDGKADVAIWRPSSAQWWVLRSSDNSVMVFTWGNQSLGDIVAVGDYDGDGKADMTVWRPSNGVWYIQYSSGGTAGYQFGSAGDVPVPAKYDSDNKTDLAVWKPSTGTWYIQRSSNQTVETHLLGSDAAGQMLVPADYDGDGKADVSVWQPSGGVWTIKKSMTGATETRQLGTASDLALPSAYIRRSSAPTNQNKEIPRDGLANVSYDGGTNRINSAGWEYDLAGNQTRAVSQDGQSWLRFEYDTANRLVKVKNDAGNTIQSFVYGPTNARLITQDGNEQSNNRTYYVAANGVVISEYIETASLPNAPQWSKNYTFIGSRLLSTSTPNGQNSESVQYHHPDKLGTRLITNAGDTSVIEQVALPFGTALNSESTGSTNRRFTSYDRSPVTGLDYASNRTYDSQQGRFTQVDPIQMQAFSLSDPQSMNLYAYCGNDPVNHTDPDGLFFGRLFKWISKALKWIVIAAVVAVAVISVVGLVAGAAAAHVFATGTLLGKALAFIASIPSLIGGFISGVTSAIAGVFSFAEVGTAVVAGVVGSGVLVGGSTAAGAISNWQQRRQKKKAEKKKESVRKKIVAIAVKNKGEEAWRTDRAKTSRNGKKSPAGAYKCNQFVYDVLVAAGAPAPTTSGGWPLNAGVGGWGNAKARIRGWKVVTDGTRLPGDVISRPLNTGDATGHVAIYIGNGKSIGTGPDGTIIESTFGDRWNESEDPNFLQYKIVRWRCTKE